jgi:hypothetical protein
MLSHNQPCEAHKKLKKRICEIGGYVAVERLLATDNSPKQKMGGIHSSPPKNIQKNNYRERKNIYEKKC